MTQEWIKAIDLEKKLYHPYFDEELQFLQRHITKGNLIDLGCGNGRISQELNGKYSYYTGIDIDPELVKELNQTKNNTVKYLHSDVCKLPFDNGKFDTSLCLTTYSNFGPQLGQMLQESSRILKEKGTFIGSCFHEDALEKRLELYSQFGDIIKNVDHRGNVSFKEGMETDISCQYTQNEIQKDLEKQGFSLESIQKSGPFYLFKAVKK